MLEAIKILAHLIVLALPLPTEKTHTRLHVYQPFIIIRLSGSWEKEK